MERIRYTQLNSNTLESVQVFQHKDNGAQYRVHLIDGTRWAVVDAHNKSVAASGEAATKASAQKLARAALSELGISLSSGTRKRLQAGQTTVIS